MSTFTVMLFSVSCVWAYEIKKLCHFFPPRINIVNPGHFQGTQKPGSLIFKQIKTKNKCT